jgi:hypothetical protein
VQIFSFFGVAWMKESMEQFTNGWATTGAQHGMECEGIDFVFGISRTAWCLEFGIDGS